jgi:hypothetical protein
VDRAGRGQEEAVFDVDWMGLLTREVLRERRGALIAESCAWAVGMSDQPHHLRSGGRVAPTGLTVGDRAGAGLPLSGEEGGRLDLGDARPGSFRDALGSVGADGVLHADRFDDDVLLPFVHDTCLQAADRARRTRAQAWAELADDVGEEESDLDGVLRAGEWEAPLRIEAEHLVLAALGDVPLIEVEAEGLPLSLVRAAERTLRAAAAPPEPPPEPPAVDGDLAASLFLARAAVTASGVPVPVPPGAARALLEQLRAHGLEPDDVVAVLPELPVQPETVDAVVALLGAGA